MYKEDLALKSLNWLICNKKLTKPNTYLFYYIIICFEVK